jgi:hypothetical protein
VANITEIQYDDGCFDFVFDKGTFDCVLSGEKNASEKIFKMLIV